MSVVASHVGFSNGARATLKPPFALAATLTATLIPLLLMATAAGLWIGPRGWYDRDPAIRLTFLGQDAVVLTMIVPALIAARRLARRGSTPALVCWMGLLFYVAYFYYFYVVGGRFSPLFPLHIAVLSISFYALLALVVGLDLRSYARFPQSVRRATATFLIMIALIFATLWTGMIASRLWTGMALEPVPRFVIAIDGVVLLPLCFAAGVWTWRNDARGVAIAGVVLAKSVATFWTLVATTAALVIAGQPFKVGETAVYGAAFIISAVLLRTYLAVLDAGTRRRTPASPQGERV